MFICHKIRCHNNLEKFCQISEKWTRPQHKSDPNSPPRLQSSVFLFQIPYSDPLARRRRLRRSQPAIEHRYAIARTSCSFSSSATTRSGSCTGRRKPCPAVLLQLQRSRLTASAAAALQLRRDAKHARAGGWGRIFTYSTVWGSSIRTRSPSTSSRVAHNMLDEMCQGRARALGLRCKELIDHGGHTRHQVEVLTSFSLLAWSGGRGSRHGFPR